MTGGVTLPLPVGVNAYRALETADEAGVPEQIGRQLGALEAGAQIGQLIRYVLGSIATPGRGELVDYLGDECQVIALAHGGPDVGPIVTLRDSDGVLYPLLGDELAKVKAPGGDPRPVLWLVDPATELVDPFHPDEPAPDAEVPVE